MAKINELNGANSQEKMQNTMDTIRDNASEQYKSLVPSAFSATIQDVGNPILQYSVVQNEFLTALVNRIAMAIVDMRRANNPLAILKKGEIPLGQDVQEIFTNMAEAKPYDPTGINLLQREIPDVKSIYHRMNRQDRYKVTINDDQLRQAFITWSDLENLTASIINSLYSGDNYDEFRLMKALFGNGVVATPTPKIKSQIVPVITDEATAKTFVKAVRTATSLFTFPSTNFNTYTDLNPTDTKPIVTWTPRENQILIIRTDVVTNIDVDVLAVAFNMSKTDLLARMIEVDNFGTLPDGTEIAPNCYAILADVAWPQVYDNLSKTEDFRNAEGLYWNYFYHHWQTYSFSLFANALAFVHA